MMLMRTKTCIKSELAANELHINTTLNNFHTMWEKKQTSENVHEFTSGWWSPLWRHLQCPKMKNCLFLWHVTHTPSVSMNCTQIFFRCDWLSPLWRHLQCLKYQPSYHKFSKSQRGYVNLEPPNVFVLVFTNHFLMNTFPVFCVNKKIKQNPVMYVYSQYLK